MYIVDLLTQFQTLPKAFATSHVDHDVNLNNRQYCGSTDAVQTLPKAFGLVILLTLKVQSNGCDGDVQ